MKLSRDDVHALVSDADSSKTAWWLSLYFDLLVIFSLVALCFQTVPNLRHYELLWFIIESVLSGQFALRLLLRLFTSSFDTVFSSSILIDILCIIPWPVELYIFLSHSHVSIGVRFMRIFRLARIMSCGYFGLPEMKLFSRAIRKSRAAFQFLAGYGLASLVLFAWLIFVAETASCRLHQGKLMESDHPCQLQSMFDALWLCLCTVMTVGYGDLYPQTRIGKMIASVMMLASYVSLPLPITIFGANLTELYLEARLKKRQRRLGAQYRLDEDETWTMTECSEGHYETWT